MKNSLITLVIFTVVSCQIDEPFDYQSTRDLLVVNSLISPDSLITVSLTKTSSVPLQEATFEVVPNASIQLFENDSLIGLPTFEEKSQRYIMDYTPLPGKSYSIVVEAEGYSTLSASTILPDTPDVSGCFTLADLQTGCTGCLFSQANLSFRDIKPDSRFWLTNYLLRFARNENGGQDSSVVERYYGGMYSNSSLPDPFNSAQDEGHTSYDIYMRIQPEADQTPDFLIGIYGQGYWSTYQFDELQRLDPMLGLYIVVMHTSPELDQYMKDLMINYMNDLTLIDEVPNPFAQKVNAFSNVENGTGLFAGYNPVTIPIHEQQCE